MNCDNRASFIFYDRESSDDKLIKLIEDTLGLTDVLVKGCLRVGVVKAGLLGEGTVSRIYEYR